MFRRARNIPVLVDSHVSFCVASERVRRGQAGNSLEDGAGLRNELISQIKRNGFKPDVPKPSGSLLMKLDARSGS